jgi:hypothetical protein
MKKNVLDGGLFRVNQSPAQPAIALQASRGRIRFRTEPMKPALRWLQACLPRVLKHLKPNTALRAVIQKHLPVRTLPASEWSRRLPLANAGNIAALSRRRLPDFTH